MPRSYASLLFRPNSVDILTPLKGMYSAPGLMSTLAAHPTEHSAPSAVSSASAPATVRKTTL